MVRDGLRAALTEDAFGLAALRVAVVGVLLVSPELHAAKALAQRPELLVATPEGLGFLAGVSFSPELVGAIRVVAITAGATALFGYWARLSCALLTLAAAFLISFSQRTGAALHDMHLLWLLALLATSRCADVWALDAWGKGVPGPSLAYGVPLCLSRALLGVVYFFPGLHKLWFGGLSWGAADNVRAILYSKWFQHGHVPALRVDQFPDWLLTAGTASHSVLEWKPRKIASMASTKVRRLTAVAAGGLPTFKELGECVQSRVPISTCCGRAQEPKDGRSGDMASEVIEGRRDVEERDAARNEERYEIVTSSNARAENRPEPALRKPSSP